MKTSGKLNTIGLLQLKADKKHLTLWLCTTQVQKGEEQNKPALYIMREKNVHNHHVKK